MIEGGVVNFVRADHIGRPVFATKATGAKVWSATYTPFGGVHVSSGVLPSARFPGQWFQSESGLHQNWMRDYDPTTGRYLQADPLGLVDGASVYGYVKANPGRWIDPRGEFVGDPTKIAKVIPTKAPPVGSAQEMGGGGGGGRASAAAVAAAIAAMTGSTQVPTEGEQCENDCLQKIADVYRYLNEIKKRVAEYSSDPLGLPEVGAYPPGSRSGHRKAIRGWQAGLRRLLAEAEAMGCSSLIPDDAWSWATKPV